MCLPSKIAPTYPAKVLVLGSSVVFIVCQLGCPVAVSVLLCVKLPVVSYRRKFPCTSCSFCVGTKYTYFPSNTAPTYPEKALEVKLFLTSITCQLGVPLTVSVLLFVKFPVVS